MIVVYGTHNIYTYKNVQSLFYTRDFNDILTAELEHAQMMKDILRNNMICLVTTWIFYDFKIQRVPWYCLKPSGVF